MSLLFTDEQEKDLDAVARIIYDKLIQDGTTDRVDQMCSVIITHILKSERNVANLHIFDTAMNIAYLIGELHKLSIKLVELTDFNPGENIKEKGAKR